ncbi:MAG: glycoside hydrolase family 43 protein, partial [Bacteroidaceae bacterium]|nr:glycoside hydrolase family 43 protein [Bacteroidaceae bacterium]
MIKPFLLGIAALFSLPAVAQTAHTAAELRAMAQEQNGSVISIHDPSVVYRGGQYYVWGSHLGVAKSTDLIQWTGLNADASTFRRLANPGDAEGTNCTFADAFNHQQVVRTVNCDGAEADLTLVDAENFCNWYATDKENHINGNMWAPDIIYNEQMKKWCMYLSLNGDHWASVIILLTSNTATGPFTYQGPVVMSGFNGDAAAPSYQLTDLELACGNLTSLPARYKQQGKWGSYWPNCIDPCVFYDEEGQLWMAYGSWSGGIWLLRLNNATGLRDYTYHPASNYATAGASVTADPYFGTRIAGGHYVSGEGSYIQHIGDYYYLFMSYGGYAPDGGYDMRIFRSTQPEGPYTDASGNTATYTEYQLNYGPNANTNRGMHLMGAYNQWGGVQNVGECAQGHNSACTDDKGRSFVVYHTKFNDGSVGHQVRVHQLFVNEKGWLVAAPFCYRGETEQTFTADEVVGDYHMLLHPYKLDHSNYQEQTEQTISLTADGTVKGAYTGTWQLNGDKLTIKLGATMYYGVVCPQHINGATTQNYKTTELAAVAFTAMAQNGVPVWGYKLEPASAVAWNYTQHAVPVKNAQVVNSNISLMYATTDNTTLTWTSSEPDVISSTGRFAPAQDIVPVTLTARLECADHYWEEAFNVKAQKETFPSGDWLTGLVGYFTFDESPVLNQYKPATETDYAKMTIGRLGSGVKPELTSDWEHDYLHTYFGVQGNNSYARVANPLYGRTDVEGFSVSAWLRRN